MRSLDGFSRLLLASGYGFQAVLALSQPSCSMYTFYYNNVAELGSATSAFFSSMSACSPATSEFIASPVVSETGAATTSAQAAATSVAGSCNYNAVLPSEFKNPGFECIDLNNFGWGRDNGAILASSPLAHGGSHVLKINTGNAFSQAIDVPTGTVVKINFWARLEPGNESLDGCYLRAFADSATFSGDQFLYNFYDPPGSHLTPSATQWTLFTFTYDLIAGQATGGQQRFLLVWAMCSQQTSLLVDDFSVTLTTLVGDTR